jgi:starch phosphorylase
MYFCDVQVHLGRLQPNDVRIEMYADPLCNEPPFHERMTLAGNLPDADGFYGYLARVPASRPADHYTPRAVPCETAGTVPLEIPLITWQK